jgi:hypothetical protein
VLTACGELIRNVLQACCAADDSGEKCSNQINKYSYTGFAHFIGKRNYTNWLYENRCTFVLPAATAAMLPLAEDLRCPIMVLPHLRQVVCTTDDLALSVQSGKRLIQFTQEQSASQA